MLISPFDFTYLCVRAPARACVLLSSIIDCLLFVTRGAVTGVLARDVEAEAEAGSGSGGSGLFLWKRKRKREKFHRFRFHIGGRMEREKKLVLLSFVEERIGEHKH